MFIEFKILHVMASNSTGDSLEAWLCDLRFDQLWNKFDRDPKNFKESKSIIIFVCQPNIDLHIYG